MYCNMLISLERIVENAFIWKQKAHFTQSAILCKYPQLALQQMSVTLKTYYIYLRFSFNYKTFLYKCFIILETKSTKPLKSDYLSVKFFYAANILKTDLFCVDVIKC